MLGPNHRAQRSGGNFAGAPLKDKPLLSDPDDSTSFFPCVLCEPSSRITSSSNPAELCRLFWWEYDPAVNTQGTQKLCDHCFYPIPRLQQVMTMCQRTKHLYCMYCVELMMFRIQLGRFVQEKDDGGDDLGLQWELDYVDSRKRSGHKHHTVSKGNGTLCGCFKRNNDLFVENSEERRKGTTRLSGYRSAQDQVRGNFGDSMIEIEFKQPKMKNGARASSIAGDDDNDEKEVIDEIVLDQMYQDKFEIDEHDNLRVKGNLRKFKATQMLMAALTKDGVTKQIPSVLVELDYDKYAVYCFAYVMGKLELKQRRYLFDVLEFIAMVSPTTVMIQLIIEYKKQFLMLPYKRADRVLLAVIRGSKYSIATALKMASLAKEFAAIDLSAKDVFMKLAEKYEAIAVELIKQIESHHLAALLLETPSDIEGMTPFDLAFEYELFTFLSQSKIEKIAHQVWIEQFFLNPHRTFEVSDVDAWNVLEFLKTPSKFYFRPIGKWYIQVFLYVSYLLIFSAILYARPNIYDVPETIEILFWVFNLGYMGFECYQAFIEDGLKLYLTSWTNYIDMSISINFVAQIVLRVLYIFNAGNFVPACDNDKLAPVQINYNDGLMFAGHQRCPTQAQIASLSGYWLAGCVDTFHRWPLPSDDRSALCDFNASNAFYVPAPDKCDCWKQLDYYLEDSCCRQDGSVAAVAFHFLYGFNAILLWMRLLYFAEQDATLGPLIKIIMAMGPDFVNYVKLTLLFLVGFSFAIRAFMGEFSAEFSSPTSTALYMFLSTFGKIDFSVLEGCGEAENDLCKDKGWLPYWRSNFGQLLLCVYLVIALVMIRLLIAMITYTYNRLIKQAEHQVVYQRIKNTYDLDDSSGLMPPPLNIFVFAAFLVWIIMDVLMVILINRYIDIENKLQLAKPVGSSYMKRVFHGIQDLFVRNRKYWICAHCREHNYTRYQVKDYLSQFRPACDPADADIVAVYSPTMCQRCYRNKTVVGRMTIVLQQISYLIFLVTVWPCLVIIWFIPALFSWIGDYLSDDSSGGNWVDSTDDDEDDKQSRKQYMMRRQTMMGGSMMLDINGRPRSVSEYKKTREYQELKAKQKKKRKEKEQIEKAEMSRKSRQMRQLASQLEAVPDVGSQTTISALSKSLRQIVKNYSPRKGKQILAPNINDIVDEVTSDKTPISKLQQQVAKLQSTVDGVHSLMEKLQKMTAVNAFVNTIQSYDGMDDDEDRDSSEDVSNRASPANRATPKLGAVKSKPVNRRESALKLLNTLSGGGNNRKSPKPQALLPSTGLGGMHAGTVSVHDITAMLNGDPLGDEEKAPAVRVNEEQSEIIFKPTDAMRHRYVYLKQQQQQQLEAEQRQQQQEEDDAERPIVSNIAGYDLENDQFVSIASPSIDLVQEEEPDANKKPRTSKNALSNLLEDEEMTDPVRHQNH